MRNIFTFITFLLIHCNVFSQKEDYIWLSGYDSNIGYDTIAHHYLGIDKLDFKSNPRNVTYDSTIGINFARTIVNYSDTSGNILFYSNGIEIRNKWDEVIANSREMDEGWLIGIYDPDIATYGYRSIQGDIVLEIPDQNNQFLFFQCFIDSNTGITDFDVPKILTTYLSMTDNNSHGNVLYRDSTLINDTLSIGITACRHANGRDWWLLAQKLNSNCYYRILLTSGGAQVLPDKTCAGVPSPYGGGGSCSFSPDGSKYVVLDYLKGVLLYDFDRCEGNLSNPHNYPIPSLLDSLWAINGISFSPNSRFLYISITEYVIQFDTWQSDPLSNPDTIGRYDGFADPFGSYYCASQLAPDGKIYITSGNGESNYSLIDSPDQKGAACHFMHHGLPLSAYQLGVPNNPNYRLGRLAGSPCDTLTGLRTLNNSIPDIKLYPNPSQDYFILDYGFTDWSKYDGLNFSIQDISGQTLYSAVLPRFSALRRVSVVSLAAGIYIVAIRASDGSTLSAKKLVKE